VNEDYKTIFGKTFKASKVSE